MTVEQDRENRSPGGCTINTGESGFLSFEQATLAQIVPETGLSDLPELADSYFRVSDAEGGFHVERIEVPAIGRGETLELNMAEVRGLMLEGGNPEAMLSAHPNYSDSRFEIERSGDGYKVTRNLADR